MKPPDLEVVFGKGAPGAEMDEGAEDMGAMEGEDAEMDEALDSAIDDVFASKDPEARREAFKTAIRLCKESSY